MITRTYATGTTVTCSHDTRMRLNKIKLSASKQNMDEVLKMLLKQARGKQWT